MFSKELKRQIQKIQFTMCNNVSNFIEDICSDVRKIVETVFKNDKQEDIDRITKSGRPFLQGRKRV